jgi:transposase-like protein
MRESMEIYPRTAAERAMKLQEVLLRATSGKIEWWQAAELMGISERQMRRWRKCFEEQGHQGLLDQRQRKPSSRRVPKAQAEEVLSLYRDKYFDLNVRHFHEKLREDHQIGFSYTWVNCCPFRISTLSSLCRTICPLSSSRTSGCFTICSTAPAQRRCSNWLAIPITWERISNLPISSTSEFQNVNARAAVACGPVAFRWKKTRGSEGAQECDKVRLLLRCQRQPEPRFIKMDDVQQCSR